MRAEVSLLTKSDYVTGLECPKRLYLRKYRRELEEQPGDGARARMADGQEIGRLARLLFPGGILIEARGEEALKATALMMNEAETLFEAQFVSDGRLVRVDILQKTPAGWRVIEVKSSKEPDESDKHKARNLHDLAFQVLVLREAGINVTSVCLMLLSRGYKAPASGDVDLPSLFAVLDVTEETDKLLLDTQFRSIAMLRILSQEEEPVIETNVFCHGCGFHTHCHDGQRDDDLVFLPRIKAAQVTELRRTGVLAIGDIPNCFKLSSSQVQVRNVFRDGRPFVDEGLEERLAALQYPIFFIDFEATAWAVPFLPSTESYQPIPFQWSAHIQEGPGTGLIHKEFLWRTADDPRPSFAKALWDCVRDAGSIVVYSGYEMNVLNRLAREGIGYGIELSQKMSQKGLDLLKIVQDCVYLPEFRGSRSIKKVLPALVPGLSYDDLQIKEGETAAVEYKRMIAPATMSFDADQIAKALLAYCKRDTEAMVELCAAIRLLALKKRSGAADSKPCPDDTKHDQLVLNIWT